MDTFIYNSTSYIFNVSTSKEQIFASNFDTKLQTKWNQKVDEGMFRYKLHITDEKNFNGKFYLQLNVNRAALRRKPVDITSINQPFNSEQFNFTKLKEGEILFQLKNEVDTTEYEKHVLAINDSPMEFGHVLLIPSIDEKLPQILTKKGLQLAVEMMLLSGSPYFRIGFNSLGGCATVNQLHLHGYYLQQNLFLESAKVQMVTGNCYKLTDFPSKGFVFQIRTKCEMKSVIEDVYKLVEFLQRNNLPHNLYITRGLDFETAENDSGYSQFPHKNCLRICVWARKPAFGIKNMTNINPATCELFGHLVIKDEEEFKTISEEEINEIFTNLTETPFQKVLANIHQIFGNDNTN